MADLVSKSSVLDIYAELYDIFDDNKAVQKELDKVYDKLRRLKEQEYKSLTNGYWIHPTTLDCCCSICGEQPEREPGSSVPLYNYCPYCGAKMEVKWDEAD